MLFVAILLMPQVVYGFSYENSKMTERIQWLNSDEFERDMEELRQTRYTEVDVVVTAYSQGDECNTGDTMANGEKVHEGAVAYNGVKFGTKIEIDGKQYIVKDRCGSDGAIDIYMNSVKDCESYGRQRKIVRIEVY